MIHINGKKGICEIVGEGDVIYEELTYALHVFYERLDDKKLGDETLDRMVKKAKMTTDDIINECLESDDAMVRVAARLLKDLTALKEKLDEHPDDEERKTDANDLFGKIFDDLLDDEK